MENLQELFDAYLLTKPSAEKIRAATVMMIHVGKAMNVVTQEEITSEYYDEIAEAIDDFFSKTPQKAILDKAILAEMIGRIGPNGKLKRLFKSLLADKDENVRQFTLASLEYTGQKQPKTMLSYVELYRNSVDDSMKMIAVDLIAKLLCQGKHKSVLPKFKIWCREDNGVFAAAIIQRVKELDQQNMCSAGFEHFKKWSEENCSELWQSVFSTDAIKK